MAHDPELVEIVTAWLQHGRTIMGRRVMRPVEGGGAVARSLAQNLLDTIDASGKYWVAPHKIDRREFEIRMTPWPEDSDVLFARIRNTLLAERQGTP